MQADTQSAALRAMKPPHSLADAVELRDLLATYSDHHGPHVALLLASVYVFMQCFGAPLLSLNGGDRSEGIQHVSCVCQACPRSTHRS